MKGLSAPRLLLSLSTTNQRMLCIMHSWEIGTLAEALTELEWKQLGVFAPGSIPPPARLAPGEAADVMSIAET
jgi:hypothetical protein